MDPGVPDRREVLGGVVGRSWGDSKSKEMNPWGQNLWWRMSFRKDYGPVVGGWSTLKRKGILGK